MTWIRLLLFAAALASAGAVRADGPVVLEGHTSGVRALQFSPDGTALASGGFDGSVRVWNVKERRTTRIQMPGGEVRQLAFSPDGKLLAASNSLGVVRLWSVQFGMEKKKIQAAPGRLPAIMGLGFFADGGTLAVGLADGSVKVFDAISGRLVRTLSEPERSHLSAFTIPPQADAPVIGTPAQKVLLLDAETGATLESQDVPEDYPGMLACAPSGGRVAATAGIAIRLFRFGGGVPSTSLLGHSGPVEAVDFDRDGKWLASCSRDRTVRLWDVDAGTELWKAWVETATPLSVALSPEGKWVAAGDSGGKIRVWRLKGIPRD